MATTLITNSTQAIVVARTAIGTSDCAIAVIELAKMDPKTICAPSSRKTSRGGPENAATEQVAASTLATVGIQKCQRESRRTEYVDQPTANQGPDDQPDAERERHPGADRAWAQSVGAHEKGWNP